MEVDELSLELLIHLLYACTRSSQRSTLSAPLTDENLQELDVLFESKSNLNLPKLREYAKRLRRFKKMEAVDPFHVAARPFWSQSSAQCKPDAVILLESSVSPSASQFFNESVQQHGSQIAYHGSSFDRFRAILDVGLLPLSQTKLQRVGALYGDGIYFSQELSAGKGFSQAGLCWSEGKHLANRRLSIVLACEVAMSPAVICRTSSSSSSNSGIPETYLVVPNANLVQIRALLLYSNSPIPMSASPSSSSSAMPPSSVSSPAIPRHRHHDIIKWAITFAIVAFIIWLGANYLAHYSPNSPPYIRRIARSIVRSTKLK